MEKENYRPGRKNQRFQYSALELSSNEHDAFYNDKTKYKRNVRNSKKKIENNSYMVNWPAQARLHPFGQRSYSTPDSTICHYSVPLSFSFEPLSLPVYSTIIPQGNCATPSEISGVSKKSKQNNSYKKSRKNKTDSLNGVPAIFHTPRINNGDQQDFTSLPPVSCDVYGSKASDNEISFKRRFSDPGLGQLSSDDCSSSRSEDSSGSTATVGSQDFFFLVEQINKLKESNSHLKRELQETKLELECLKLNSQAWGPNEGFKPGTLSDAICEIRNAVKLSEEALISKATFMLEKTISECKENQVTLEEKLKKEWDERLTKLEDRVRCLSQRDEVTAKVLPEIGNALRPTDFTIQQQVAELEKEKFQMRKELQEAVAKRKSAEATTEKLENLVAILRKKINGVSLESSMADEKQAPGRPLASFLEKNPFIIANNRLGQKQDVSTFQKPKIPFKAFPQEGGVEVVNLVVATDNKENETIEANGSLNDSFGGNHATMETSSTVGPQVTMTGPVTDL